jgi:hypothetical protein
MNINYVVSPPIADGDHVYYTIHNAAIGPTTVADHIATLDEATFIALACNNYQSLVTMLQRCVDRLKLNSSAEKETINAARSLLDQVMWDR